MSTINVVDLRDALERLLKTGVTSVTVTDDIITVEVDDHISDEDVAQTRMRTLMLIRKPQAPDGTLAKKMGVSRVDPGGHRGGPRVTERIDKP